MAQRLYRGFHSTAKTLGSISRFPQDCKVQGISFAYFEVCIGNISQRGGDSDKLYQYGRKFSEAGLKVGPYHRMSAASGKEQGDCFVKAMTTHQSLLPYYTLRPALYVPEDQATRTGLVDEIEDWVKTVVLALYAAKDRAVMPLLAASARTIEIAGLTKAKWIRENMPLWLHGGEAADLQEDGWRIPIWLREADFPISQELLPLDFATTLGPDRFHVFPKVTIESVPFMAGLATVGGAWYTKNVIFKGK